MKGSRRNLRLFPFCFQRKEIFMEPVYMPEPTVDALEIEERKPNVIAKICAGVIMACITSCAVALTVKFIQWLLF